MLPRADRSAISCIKSSNSLIRASLYVNSGTVLLSCFNIAASRVLLSLVQRARTDKNNTYLVRASMPHSIQERASPATTFYTTIREMPGVPHAGRGPELQGTGSSHRHR